MKRHNISIKLLLLATSLTLSASVFGSQKTATSQIKNVMIYPQGAMVKRTATVSLTAGINEVKIPMLTPLLDQKSVQVGVTDKNVTLVNVKYDAEIPEKKQITTEATSLCKQLSALNDSIEIYTKKKEVLDREKDLIIASRNIGGDQGFNANTLQGVASYMRKDLSEITTLNYNYTKRIEEYNKKIKTINQKINLLYDKQMEPMSCLILTLDAKSASKAPIDIQYFVDEASWTPFYEVRIAETNKPLELIQKAYVNQSSQETWNNVNLTLSQCDPSVNNEKPELLRYNLPSTNVAYMKNDTKEDNTHIKVIGIVRDEKQPLKGALITCDSHSDIKTETDENGYYEILVPKGNYLYYSYEGHSCEEYYAKGKNVAVKNITLEKGSIPCGHSEVTGSHTTFGCNVLKSKSNSYAIDDDKTSFRNYATDLDGKYSIPDDGAQHEVLIKDSEVKTEYSYYAIPKLSNNVYLVAAIDNWKNLDLQDGKVKLFLKNVYMGESQINAKQTEDTLLFSVGVDKDLAVERKDLKTYNSKNNKIEKNWQITVKNNKSIPVTIKIEDQYPISNNSDIKVELTNNGGAEVDEIEGKLTWKVSLKAGEKKDLQFSYTVKAPKNVVINVK